VEKLIKKAQRASAQPKALRKLSGHSVGQTAMRERKDILPTTLPPRGISRVCAAAYIGVSPSLFDEMVKDGRMPKPVRTNGRTVWDRLALDAAFAALSDDADDNDPWGKVAL
jgi:predicted DNA-binding transcriptional regulator AlpA